MFEKIEDMKEKMEAFLDAYEQCLADKTTTFFENFQLEYVQGSSPLPSTLNAEIGKQLNEEEFILLSLKSSHCIKVDEKENIREEIITLKPSSGTKHEHILDADHLDFTTNNFEDTINPPCLDALSAGVPLELHDYQKDLILSDENTKVADQRRAIDAWQSSSLLSFYNIGIAKRLKKNPKFGVVRLWVMSDAGDFNGSVFSSTLLTLRDADKENVDVGLLPRVNSVNVSCKKYQHNTDDDEVSIRSLFTNTILNSQKLKMRFSSTYMLHRSTVAIDNVANSSDKRGDGKTQDDKADDGESFVKVVMKWKGESCILAPPPSHACATLSMKVRHGEVSKGTSLLYNDLCTLKRMEQGLDEGVLEWQSGEEGVVLKQLQELIEDNTKGKKQHLLFTTPHNDTKQDEGVFKLQESRELDFVDRVWNILRGSTRYSDITQGISLIFTALQQISFQPVVKSSNNSTLAQLINQSKHSNIQKEIHSWSRDDRPLLLVLEAGVEKLKMDYLSTILQSRLANMKALSMYLGNLDYESVNDKLRKLFKLHHVMESILLLQLHTNLPHSILSTVFSETLQRPDMAADGSFSLRLPVVDLYHLIESSSPAEWKCLAIGSVKQTSGVDEKSDKDGENEKDNENEKDDDEDDDDEDVDDDNDDNDDEELTNKDGRVLNCIHLSGLSIFPHLKDCHDEVDGLSFRRTYMLTSVLQTVF